MKQQTLAAIIVVALIVIAAAALFYWQHVSSLNAPGASGKVDLTGDRGTVRLAVEVADNESEREFGLMNRTSLAADAGMLFVFEDDQRWAFWMEDTLIPLDMIFIAENQTIVYVRENATPMSRDIIMPSSPCRYVLEVNGGLCAAEGIRAGDHADLNA